MAQTAALPYVVKAVFIDLCLDPSPLLARTPINLRGVLRSEHFVQLEKVACHQLGPRSVEIVAEFVFIDTNEFIKLLVRDLHCTSIASDPEGNTTRECMQLVK